MPTAVIDDSAPVTIIELEELELERGDAENQLLADLWKAVDDSDILSAAMIIKKCTAQNVEINKPRRSDGATLLSLATQHGQAPLIKLLCRHGFSADSSWNGRTPLYIAARAGFCDAIQVLSQFQVDVNRPRLDNTAADGSTPLIAACRGGHSAACRLLLDLKADPKIRASDGTSCIYVAAQG